MYKRQALGGVIGAVTMLTGMNPDAPISNIFTGGTLSAGQGGIIGVIFAVWLLSLLSLIHIYRLCDVKIIYCNFLRREKHGT